MAAIVSSAQRRFTAVGRVAASAAQAARKPASEGSARIANQTPYAAAAPMSGAPRTCMLAIARATSATVRNGRTTNVVGQRGLVDDLHRVAGHPDRARWSASNVHRWSDRTASDRARQIDLSRLYLSAPDMGVAPGLAVSVTAGTGDALPESGTSLGTITPRLADRVSGCWTFEGCSSGDTRAGGFDSVAGGCAVAQASSVHPSAIAHSFARAPFGRRINPVQIMLFTSRPVGAVRKPRAAGHQPTPD